MTKLNDAQAALLAQVGEVNAEVDREIAKHQETFDRQKEAAREPLRAVIALAVAAKVPARRLGEAINTSDHKTIKSYFPVAEGGAT